MTLQPTEKLAHHLRRFPEDRQAKDRPGAADRPATASWSVLLAFPATCSALSTGSISGSRVAIPEVQVVIAAVVVVTVVAAADAAGGGALRKGKAHIVPLK